MSNIRVDVKHKIEDGSKIAFRAPVDCSAITGLVVYYPAEDGTAASKEFVLADAHGHDVGNIDHLFAENVIVKVILDVTAGMAYVQNADTNAYIESTFIKSVNGVRPNSETGDVEIPLMATVEEYFEANPVKDGGYYIPTVKMQDGVLVFTFRGNSNMPDLPPQPVKIPVADLSGYVRTVNGEAPDENGNVTLNIQEGVSDDLRTALVGYFSHVMPQFDDPNGLAYTNAVLTALGAEIRDDNTESPGITPDEPETPHAHSYTVVTTEATCTTDGVKTYTCACGESYAEAIPATGHCYVDGVCSVCGAADPDAADAGWEDGVPYVFDNWTGGYVNNVGNVAAFNGLETSDYMPCAGVAYITVTMSDGFVEYGAWYDAEKKRVSSLTVSGNTSWQAAVPENAVYFRLTKKTTCANFAVTPHA